MNKNHYVLLHQTFPLVTLTNIDVLQLAKTSIDLANIEKKRFQTLLVLMYILKGKLLLQTLFFFFFSQTETKT